MNAPAAIPAKDARRAAWEGYAEALTFHRPCKTKEERSERCRLLELRDAAARMKHRATQPTWNLLEPLEEAAAWYAFADIPVETLKALRMSLVTLWAAATQMHLAFPPDLMTPADGR